MTTLAEAEKVDVRRFCGYPAYGMAPAPLQSWRFFQTYGLLEYRLNNLSDAEVSVVRRYLGTLTSLELAIPAASSGLDTDQAASWTRNKDEIAERLRLFDTWRRRLCGFLGVEPGSGMGGSTATLVV
ncbi:MAG: hypothetical protein INR62_05630 [Rhodospirillales bacterium]|nr:hypothetical protein [Acetobacter sp.]